MAFTTFLTIASLVIIASAGFPAWNDDYAFPGFSSPLMTMRFAAPPVMSPPTMPGMPKFPFPFFGQFPAFPTMPSMTFPPMPSLADIAKAKPGKGGTYNGIVVSMQSEAKTNEDGTVVKKGGSTVMINDNGKVTVKKTGDGAPDILPTSSRSSFNINGPKIKAPNPHRCDPFNHFGFDNFHHFPDFKPISRDAIKNYVPGKGETFLGHSSSSHSYSSNINGVKNEGGFVSKVNNYNGAVTEKSAAYHKGDAH